MGNFLTSWAC